MKQYQLSSANCCPVLQRLEMGAVLASLSKAFPVALVLQPRCLPPKRQKHIRYNQIYLHNVPDKVAQDHFPRWVMADGSGGSADVGGSLCRSKESFSLAHRIKTQVEIQQIKCRNVQHPLILK